MYRPRYGKEAEPQSLVMGRARAEPGNFRESFESYKPPNNNCLSKLRANIILLKSIPIPPQRIHYIHNIPESDNSHGGRFVTLIVGFLQHFLLIPGAQTEQRRLLEQVNSHLMALTRKMKRGTDICS